ncbi:DsbA family oxidoreductase [Glaciihabitans sp. UYNi722]|uniref:DsbA family oxidoreductase n=1 Tax=Glaciihabitans sp. UYNi722 TaxID=3156344 RepID=UPI003391E78D
MTFDHVTDLPVRVEIWADVQCVWCYVADARWADALSQYGRPVETVHRSFELQSDSPVNFDARAYLHTQRGMTPEDQERAFEAMTRVTAAEGLDYDPARIRPTNSHLALELLHYADAHGQRQKLNDRLYAAYFAEGCHIGRIEDLVVLAGEVGLDTKLAHTALTAGTYVMAVDTDNARARSLGVQGVPFYVINNTYGISGAQPTNTFVEALTHAAASS